MVSVLLSFSDKPEAPEKEDTAVKTPSAAGRFLAFAAETALLLVLGLLCAAYLICRGPSPRAAERFSAEAETHRALAPLAALFLPEAESAGEELSPAPAAQTAAPAPTGPSEPAAAEDEDPDGDGIIVRPVFGRGFSGYMMTVLDPSRVIVGCVPSSFGGRGFTVGDLAERFEAVAGINAGGFLDEGGMGSGAYPDSLVVFEGEIYFGARGTGRGFVGLDREHRLHVGIRSVQEILDADIQYGVCFGPVLIRDGVMSDPAELASEVNPRSAVGQREDGAILLLVVDGRQAASLGATTQDLADIMADYGAVNACNLDGGSSSLLWYDGAYLNLGPLMRRPRPVPDAFLVLKEGG